MSTFDERRRARADWPLRRVALGNDLLSCLRVENCDFVVVGAHALAAHGAPRATGDLDVFVRPTKENAERTFRALLRFGAPLQAHGVTPTTRQPKTPLTVILERRS